MSRDLEIDECHPSVRADHDVARVEIAIDDPAGVQRLKRPLDPLGEIQRPYRVLGDLVAAALRLRITGVHGSS